MVDPLEALINLARTDADLSVLTAGRVAAKHLFGDGWGIPAKALQLRADGGTPDLYTERQLLRVEARCYGETPAGAMAVYRELVRLTRQPNRARAETGAGFAIIYWLVPTSGPSLLQDPETRVDFVLVFLEAAVSEVDIP